MQKRTREILAVALLGILVLVGVAAMGYYLLVGHNWNVAASHIDDSIGQMDGYVVVLYPGTTPPEKGRDQSGAGDQVSVESSASASASESSSSSSAPSESSSESSSSSVKTATSTKKLLAEAEELYLEKGASVYVVRPDKLKLYENPYVLGKDGNRLGFMRISNSELRSAARADIALLRRIKPDFLVVLTDDKTVGSLAQEGLFNDLSIVIFDGKKGKFPDGEYCGSAYCVRTPELGEVGAVIISPSGVMSSKTVDWQ